VAVGSSLPAAETALPVLREAWAGPARWMTITGIFMLSLAGENWRRLRELRQARSLRLRFDGRHEFRAQNDRFTVMKVEITNLSGAPTTLERDWYLDVVDDAGRVTATFPGNLTTDDSTLNPHELRPGSVIFEMSAVAWISNRGRRVVRVDDIYGNRLSKEYPIRWEGDGLLDTGE
jgi:hypothetical protein